MNDVAVSGLMQMAVLELIMIICCVIFSVNWPGYWANLVCFHLVFSSACFNLLIKSCRESFFCSVEKVRC